MELSTMLRYRRCVQVHAFYVIQTVTGYMYVTVHIQHAWYITESMHGLIYCVMYLRTYVRMYIESLDTSVL